MTSDNLTGTVQGNAIQTVRQLALLLGRIVLGILMILHGKLEYDVAGGSIAGVGAMFEKQGVPLGSIAGPVNMFGEIVGGIAMIVGAAVPLVGVLMALNMVGAWVFVHNTAIFSMDGSGPELVIAMGVLSLVIAAYGSGRFGVDHLLVKRWRRNQSI